MFGKVRCGESRARRTLRRRRKPCQGQLSETPVEFEPFWFGRQQVFCLFMGLFSGIEVKVWQSFYRFRKGYVKIKISIYK